MTYSTLLTRLLTTFFSDDSLAARLLYHCHVVLELVSRFGAQPLTPTATRDFEHRLQECLRHLGLSLCDWAFNHLEEGPLPERLDHDGERSHIPT